MAYGQQCKNVVILVLLTSILLLGNSSVQWKISHSESIALVQSSFLEIEHWHGAHHLYLFVLDGIGGPHTITLPVVDSMNEVVLLTVKNKSLLQVIIDIGGDETVLIYPTIAKTFIVNFHNSSWEDISVCSHISSNDFEQGKI